MNHTYQDTIRAERFFDFRIKPPAPSAGGPASGNVRITQQSHRFQFGSNIFGLLARTGRDLDELRRLLGSLWNAGTLPFYWGTYEPAEGRSRRDAVLAAARLARQDGLALKGHPLCWHTVCADWLKPKSTPEVERLLMARIEREMSDFAGLVDTWDVVNEAVIMPVYDRDDNAITRLCRSKGVINLCLDCFRLARAINPQAKLLINDFDLSEDYARLIDELLQRGCPIDAIGLQTHMHQGYRGEDYFATILERFGRFGLPLHFTEITLLSGELVPPEIVDLNDARRADWPSTPEGEARQARDIELFYSQIYAHPLTEAMVWWDMEDGQWLNAPSGLQRRDRSTKPAWDTLKRLVRQEWWYPGSSHPVAGSQELQIRAPEGRYVMEWAGGSASFDLDRHQPVVALTAGSRQ